MFPFSLMLLIFPYNLCVCGHSWSLEVVLVELLSIAEVINVDTVATTTTYLWGGKWQPTSVFLPGKSHGQRSLVGYGPWVRKESDMT